MHTSLTFDYDTALPSGARQDAERVGGRGRPGGVLMTMHRLSQGGADRVGVLLANGFARAGIPTRLALLRDGGEAEERLLTMLRPDVTIVHAGRPMGSRHLELARGLYFIGRQIADAAPAVVLASSNNMGLVTGTAARIAGRDRPHFVMKVTNPVVRPHETGTIRRVYRHRLYGAVFAPFDRILTLSDAERRSILAIHPRLSDALETVANPYVTPAMHTGGRTDPSRNGHILTLARMMPQKRLDLLLLAFARIGRPGVRLTILGDGPERPRLEQLARSIGIADRVAMPGFFDDVVPWLRRSHVFTLSSDYEGLPAALIEALACDVPVVTTDCFAGARDLLAGADRCAVTPRGDIAALAAALETAVRQGRPPHGLAAIAAPYAVETAVAAHVEALRPFLRPRSVGTRGIA